MRWIKANLVIGISRSPCLPMRSTGLEPLRTIGSADLAPSPVQAAGVSQVTVHDESGPLFRFRSSCGRAYELIAGALASYLLGDSVLQFSTVIGTYLFAMGIGFVAVALR